MLSREEYIEQAYLYRILQQRLRENLPLQELLENVRAEVLASTRLPMALDFLLAELKHQGVLAPGMRRLSHYFTPFQTYLVEEAEAERGRFDLRLALRILEREAHYRTEEFTPQGMFFFQFEVLCRNRLRYEAGLTAMARDDIFDEAWRLWLDMFRRQIGLVDLADLIYVRSEAYRLRKGEHPDFPVLFGEREGLIALANHRKDPLFLFSALQRHLGYPQVPRPEPPNEAPNLLAQALRRLERIEARLKLMEEEQRGGIDLERFMPKPESGPKP